MKDFLKSALFFKIIVIPLLILGAIAFGILIYINIFADKLIEKKQMSMQTIFLKHI
jgi:Trk-type K+ transport system membrane component